jgi:membrane-associated protease RseP (regulator of RpoE activity)
MFIFLLLYFKRKHSWSFAEINLWNSGFWERFTYFCWFFGILNLLPIPFFDGGNIFILLWLTFLGPINMLTYYIYITLSIVILLKMINISNHPYMFPFLFREKKR